MTLMSLRHRAHRAEYNSLKNTPISIPGRKSQMTIREIWSAAAKSKRFWNAVKHIEFTPPTPIATPAKLPAGVSAMVAPADRILEGAFAKSRAHVLKALDLEREMHERKLREIANVISSLEDILK